MTATDELRRLLDERGVEYTVDHGYREFFWDFGESGIVRASAIGTRGLVQMIVTGITPAQAVEATLGRDRYSYEQFREISNAVGDAMQYAHDKAIEHPDAADPLWNLDEYVNRILKVAFEGEATLGRGECHEVISDNLNESEGMGDAWANCSECGQLLYVLTDQNSKPPNYCPGCGRKVKR